MCSPNAIKIPAPILEALWRQRCVAYIGAGFSMIGGYPSWIGLLEQLLNYFENRISSRWRKENLDAARSSLAEGRLQKSASFLRRAVGELELNAAIAECFSLERLSDAPVASRKLALRRLAKLVDVEWSGIVTTNYDQLIEYGYQRYGRDRGVAWLQADMGSSKDLAGVFWNSRARPFLVKLHGDVAVKNTVLTAEEYQGAYINNQRNSTFLNAAMLNYCFIFLGCSLTDVVVKKRERLANEFGGGIPLAWAVLPETSYNSAMERRLQRAMIEPLVYAVSDQGGNRHRAFDSFLADLGRASRWNKQTLHRLSRLSVYGKIKQIGRLNVLLVSCLSQAPERTCNDLELRGNEIFMKAGTLKHKERKLLLSLGEEERFYRMLFLAAIGLVQEAWSGATRNFTVDATVSKAIAEAVVL